MNLNLDNTNDPLGPANYATGTAYTNEIFDNAAPVYRFAFFDMTGAADVNLEFGNQYVPVGSAFDTFFQTHAATRAGFLSASRIRQLPNRMIGTTRSMRSKVSGRSAR